MMFFRINFTGYYNLLFDVHYKDNFLEQILQRITAYCLTYIGKVFFGINFTQSYSEHQCHIFS